MSYYSSEKDMIDYERRELENRAYQLKQELINCNTITINGETRKLDFGDYLLIGVGIAFAIWSITL